MDADAELARVVAGALGPWAPVQPVLLSRLALELPNSDEAVRAWVGQRVTPDQLQALLDQSREWRTSVRDTLVAIMAMGPGPAWGGQ